MVWQKNLLVLRHCLFLWQYIQKYIVGLEELTADSKLVADVDSDGAVSVMDATSIQKYIIGLDGCGKVGQQFVTE